MKTMLVFSTVIVCLICLVLQIPVAAAQKTEHSQEQIAAEKAKLEAKIAELESKPLEYFGSQKNKRARIGFYKYRLEMLLEDPDRYFSEPEKFEGNIKTSD